MKLTTEERSTQGWHWLGGAVTVTVTVVALLHTLGLGTKLPSSSTSKRDSGISVASTGAGSACLRCLAGSGLRVSVTREVLYSPGLDPDMKMVETVVEGSLGVGEGSSSAATGFSPTCCSFF